MPGFSAKVAALLLLSVMAGCVSERPADFYVRGAGVHVKTGAPFASRPDLPQRVEAALGVAIQYWGGTWDDLDGLQITLLDGPYVTCRGMTRTVGCYDGELRISTTDPGAGTFRCVEQTVLVHEIGHAIIGDARHEDPRWMDFEALRVALSGQRGYSADGEVDCDIAVSVWQHPPDAR